MSTNTAHPAALSLREHKLLNEVRVRMLEKYDISHADAKLAIEVLLCFLHEQASTPYSRLVLPQIADWAWHELILDDLLYTKVCHLLGVSKPPHIRLAPADEDFESTLVFLECNFGFDLSANRWRESGWNLPSYRFNKVWLANIESLKTRNYDDILDQLSPKISSEVKGLELEWLVERVALRFDTTRYLAETILDLYRVLLSGLLVDTPRIGGNDLPSVAYWAWHEHRLSTAQYERDCRLLNLPGVISSSFLITPEVLFRV
jgi:hypothetical protein